jgi:ABC-type cobalamin/Fe3+-siderophores transport system ATPase subunit
MKESKYKFNIQTSNNGPLDIPLITGNALFVLGANGVGKSTLMHSLYQQNIEHSKRILAHRQTWFTDNALNLTASQKKQTDVWILGQDKNANSRWKDDYASQRSGLSIFNLINSENVRARNIANAVDIDNIQQAKNLSTKQAPLQDINELLALSNISIEITLGKDEQLFASKNGGELYSIAELSDGERNALLICSDVLTTEPNQLIILDEPERHLHRSIISPLLTSLFNKRKDCVFVISTHDIFLPIDHNESSVLLIRDCTWNNKNIKDWDADLISKTDEIPNETKLSILGAKRKILFVEGESTSLDKQIYQLIFPELSVVPKGSCKDVERAVEGVRGTEKLHWINVLGLIDADDRTPEQLQSLKEKGVVALQSYSVESLYYRTEIIEKIAERFADISGKSKDELYINATSKIIENLTLHKDRLCSRLCEKKIRNIAMSNLPRHQNILNKEQFQLNIDLNDEFEKEEAIFNDFIQTQNLNGLISRYPIRETPVINGIVGGLELNKDTYESAVRKLIIDDSTTKSFYRKLLGKLTDLI